MKPIVIIPPGTMSKDDIALLRENDLCVVEAENPAAVKFLDPIPAMTDRTQVDDAAIQLSRRILSRDAFGTNGMFNRSDVARLYVDCLVKGTRLDPGKTQDEKEREIFEQEKYIEIRRLAREEAKAERAKEKETRAAEKKAGK